MLEVRALDWVAKNSARFEGMPFLELLRTKFDFTECSFWNSYSEPYPVYEMVGINRTTTKPATLQIHVNVGAQEKSRCLRRHPNKKSIVDLFTPPPKAELNLIVTDFAVLLQNASSSCTHHPAWLGEQSPLPWMRINEETLICKQHVGVFQADSLSPRSKKVLLIQGKPCDRGRATGGDFRSDQWRQAPLPQRGRIQGMRNGTPIS